MFIKYCMSNVISCCVRNCDAGKIKVYDKFMISKQKRTDLYLGDELGMEFTAC